MSSPDRSRLTRFFGILLALVIALVGVSMVTAVRMVSLAPIYMFTPMIAAVATCRTTNVSFSTVGLRVGRPRWLAVAAVIALPLVGLALAVSLAIPGIGFDPAADPLPGVSLPPGVLGVLATLGIVLGVGVTINAVFAFGEEFGWRGYLLWELAPLGFWRASAVVGAVWGLWHAPIILDGYNYPSFPVGGVGMMVLATLAFSPLYTYVVLRARSVLAAALLHGVFNGSAGLVIVYAAATDPVLDELVASPVGVGGIVAFGLAALGLAVLGTPELDRAALAGE